jgi:hypothetical protein
LNFLFREIVELARDSAENKNDNPSLDCDFVSHVGMTATGSNFLVDWEQLTNINIIDWKHLYHIQLIS